MLWVGVDYHHIAIILWITLDRLKSPNLLILEVNCATNRYSVVIYQFSIHPNVRAPNGYDCLQFSKLRFSTLLVLNVGPPSHSKTIADILLILLLLDWLRRRRRALIEFRIVYVEQLRHHYSLDRQRRRSGGGGRRVSLYGDWPRDQTREQHYHNKMRLLFYDKISVPAR